MEELDVMLKEALADNYGKLKKLQPGTDEYKECYKAIFVLEKVLNEKQKIANDKEVEKKKARINWVYVGLAGTGMVLVPLIAIGVQRLTNLDLMVIEQTGSMSSKGWANDLLRLINPFSRSKITPLV